MKVERYETIVVFNENETMLVTIGSPAGVTLWGLDGARELNISESKARDLFVTLRRAFQELDDKKGTT